jgi:hypothetical protein
MNKIKNNTLSIIFYLLLQITIFNNLLIAQKYCIYIYIYIIFNYHTSKPVYNLFRAFFIGMIVDIFSNTICVHASACVFLAFLINTIFYFRASGQGEFNDLVYQHLSIKNIGVKNFVFLYFILILTHQMTLFFVDNWTNKIKLELIIQIVISTCFTFTSIFFINILNLIYKKRKDLA